MKNAWYDDMSNNSLSQTKYALLGSEMEEHDTVETSRYVNGFYKV